MADAAVFDAEIKAVDKASGPIAAAIGKLHSLDKLTQAMGHHARGMANVFNAAFGEMEHGSEHVTRELHRTGEAAHKAGHEIAEAAHPHGYDVLAGHVHLLRSRFGDLNASVGEIGHHLTDLLPALGALGAVGSVAGLFEMTEHASEAFSKLATSATSAGVTVEQFNRLSLAATMVDVPVENMTTSLFRLNRGIGDAVAGRNKDLAALFHHLGLSARDSQGHLRSAADLMPQLADAFAHTTDPAMRARMAMALFGREGMALLPLLTQGSEELKKFADTADKHSFVPKGLEAKGLEDYHRSMVTLTTSVHGFEMEMGTKLAPVLKPIVDMTADWVTANRDWITTKIAEEVSKLSKWVQTIDMKRVIKDTEEWGHKAHVLLTDIGGTKGILEALPAIKLVIWAGRTANAVRSVGLAFWGVNAAAGAVFATLQAGEAAIGATAFGALVRRILPEAAGTALRVAGPAGAFLYTSWPASTQTEEFERAGLNEWRREHGLTPLSAGGAGMPLPLAPTLPRINLTPVNPFAPGYQTPLQRLQNSTLPQLYAPGGAGALPMSGDGSANLRAKLDVDFHNAPSGMEVRLHPQSNFDEVHVSVDTGQNYPDGSVGP